MVAFSLRKPRRAPSRRDQQIFYEVTVLGYLQREVAEQQGLKQPRVSQIVNRVKRWRGGSTPLEAGEAPAAEQAQLRRWTQLRTLEETRAFAFRELRRGEAEQKPNVQWVKVILKTIDSELKIDKQPLPPLAQEVKELEWMQLWHQLRATRLKAEEEGRVKPSNDPEALVDRVMYELYAIDPPEEPPLRRSPVALVRPRGAKPTWGEYISPEKKAEAEAIADYVAGKRDTWPGQDEPEGVCPGYEPKARPAATAGPVSAAGSASASSSGSVTAAASAGQEAGGAATDPLPSANGANVEERLYESEMPPEVRAAIDSFPDAPSTYDPVTGEYHRGKTAWEELQEMEKISAQIRANGGKIPRSLLRKKYRDDEGSCRRPKPVPIPRPPSELLQSEVLPDGVLPEDGLEQVEEGHTPVTSTSTGQDARGTRQDTAEEIRATRRRLLDEAHQAEAARRRREHLQALVPVVT